MKIRIVKRPFYLIRHILLAAVFSLASSVLGGPVVDQYFPINNGDNRSYQSHKTPSNKVTEYCTATVYNGNAAFSLNFHDEWNMTLDTGTWYFGKSSTALTLHGIDTSWGSLVLTSPVDLMTDQSINDNQTIRSNVKGVQSGATFDVTVQATILPLGSITVPAGTFSNCKLLMVVETTSKYGVPFQNFDSAAWILAPNIGIIADGVAMWDYNTKLFSVNDQFGNPQDFYELVTGTIKGVSIGSTGYVAPNDSFTYKTYNGEITITKYVGSGGAVTIPSTINGLPVTSIGNFPNGGYAFSYCTNLTSVTIPNSVKSIDRQAFYGCIGLTNITFGNSVVAIGISAFQYCTHLTSVTLPSSITAIRIDAFSDCTRLLAVYFKGNAPTYEFNGSYSFINDDSVTIYYLAGTAGWGTTYGGYPTKLWIPKVEPPQVTLSRAANVVILDWSGTGFKLQSSQVIPANVWQDVVGSETNTSIRIPVGAGSHFYRLKK